MHQPSHWQWITYLLGVHCDGIRIASTREIRVAFIAGADYTRGAIWPNTGHQRLVSQLDGKNKYDEEDTKLSLVTTELTARRRWEARPQDHYHCSTCLRDECQLASHLASWTTTLSDMSWVVGTGIPNDEIVTAILVHESLTGYWCTAFAATHNRYHRSRMIHEVRQIHGNVKVVVIAQSNAAVESQIFSMR